MPPGAMPSGVASMPPGAMPSGVASMPPGAMPQGVVALPPGAMPSGAASMPPSAMPPGASNPYAHAYLHHPPGSLPMQQLLPQSAQSNTNEPTGEDCKSSSPLKKRPREERSNEEKEGGDEI